MDALTANQEYIAAARRHTDTESAARLLRSAGLDAIAEAAEGHLRLLAEARDRAWVAWRKAESAAESEARPEVPG
jgi:hypothetical protein